jgi:hypothetical protein
MLLASAAMANIPSVPLPVPAVPSKEKKRKANGENEGADGPKKRLKKDAKVEDTAEVMAQLKELFKHATLGPEALKVRVVYSRRLFRLDPFCSTDRRPLPRTTPPSRDTRSRKTSTRTLSSDTAIEARPTCASRAHIP